MFQTLLEVGAERKVSELGTCVPYMYDLGVHILMTTPYSRKLNPIENMILLYRSVLPLYNRQNRC